MPLHALGALKCCFFWFINDFFVVTFRIMTATDKHAITPLPQGQRCLTFRTELPLEDLNNMAVSLCFQRTNVLTSWVGRTAKKGAMATTTDHQRSEERRVGKEC